MLFSLLLAALAGAHFFTKFNVLLFALEVGAIIFGQSLIAALKAV